MNMMKAMLAAQTGGEAALSFLAGRCFEKVKNGGVWITSDKKKGQIDLMKDPQDQLWHFKWKNLMSGKQGLDLMLLPNSGINWYKLDYVEDGRVYELRIGSGKHFFWMQEPDETKDVDVCKKLKNIFEHGSLDEPKKVEGKGKDKDKGTEDKGTAPKPTQGQAGMPNMVPNQDALMKAVMNQMNVMATQAAAMKQPDVNIMDLLERTTMEKVLADPEVIKDLLEHAHEKLKNSDDEKVRERMQADLLSPQVQTACKTLSRVIQSGHAVQLLKELNIDKPETITVRQFLEALQEKEGGSKIFEELKDKTDSKEATNAKDKDEGKEGDLADKGKQTSSKDKAMDEDGK